MDRDSKQLVGAPLRPEPHPLTQKQGDSDMSIRTICTTFALVLDNCCPDCGAFRL